jgi:mono/diheme cytochrome c family protein
MTKALKIGVIALVVAFVAIQFVPYGRAHTNPPVTQEPAWDTPQTRELARRACFDCHSNETVWPWYASVAPASWLVQRDVDEGREHLNFSEFDRPQDDADEAAEMVQKGEMPPFFYLPLHSEARLTDAETADLVTGLQQTLGVEEGEDGGDGEENEAGDEHGGEEQQDDH